MTSPFFNVTPSKWPAGYKPVIHLGQPFVWESSFTDVDDVPLDLDGHKFRIDLVRGERQLFSFESDVLGQGDDSVLLLVPQEQVDQAIVGQATCKIYAIDPDGNNWGLFSDVAVVSND